MNQSINPQNGYTSKLIAVIKRGYGGICVVVVSVGVVQQNFVYFRWRYNTYWLLKNIKYRKNTVLTVQLFSNIENKGTFYIKFSINTVFAKANLVELKGNWLNYFCWVLLWIYKHSFTNYVVLWWATHRVFCFR